MGLTQFPNGVASYGIPVLGSSDDLTTTGSVYFVHSGTGNAANSGKSPSAALATLAGAVAKVTANKHDIVILMPGHSETTTSEITIATAGFSIIGIGNGQNRPSITANLSAAGDTVAVDSDDVKIRNVRFVTPSASQNAAIDVNAADVVIEGCLFECGANFLDGITITASGTNAIVRGNEFRVAANGPNSAVRLEGAVVGVQVIGNYFDGGSDTNAWDDAAIDGANAGGTDQVPTRTRIHGNEFLFGVGVDINSAGTTGLISYNNFAEGTLGSMLDPGALMCFENYEADAVDETGRIFPTSAAS